MRHYYAQLNDAGICTGVIDTHAEIVALHMIPIPSADPAYIGKHWTGSEWVTA